MKLKLVSPKDTLIGHIDVPEHWNEWFKRSGAASAAVLPNFMAVVEMPTKDVIPVVDIKTVTLVKAGWSRFPDAVYLFQGTVEEFEALPGCSFAPSAAYLKSHIQ